MTEEEAVKRLQQASDEWTRASDKLAETLAANQAEAQEARHELIKAWNRTPNVKNVRQRITQYKGYFADMDPEKKCDFKDVLILITNDENEKETETGSYSPSHRILNIDKKYIDIPTALIHEMLHVYIIEMDSHARADLYAKLLKKLSRKIPNFDIILGLKDSVLISRCLRKGTTPPDPDSHNNLFFVKSIDLDLRIRREPGTIFGYGMTGAINEIQEALNPLIGVRLEAQYLPLDQ